MVSDAYKRYKAQGLCRRCGDTPLPGKIRCAKCHADHLSSGKKWRDDAIASGLCRYCCKRPREADFSMCSICLPVHTERQKTLYQLQRKACIERYGGACVCCGLTTAVYLQLDHKNNDGAKHRKTFSKTGRGGTLYGWAFHNGFPDILQLLCANCHQAKTAKGGCSEEDHTMIRTHWTRHIEFNEVHE